MCVRVCCTYFVCVRVCCTYFMCVRVCCTYFMCVRVCCTYFIFVRVCAGTPSQMCRPHFHTPLHSWITDPKSMVPHAHSSWISSLGKPPSHPGATGPLSVHPGANAMAGQGSHFFSFPPTPPKDAATPDMGLHPAAVSTEYTPDNKPTKMESVGSVAMGSYSDSVSSSFCSPTHTAHPMASYPTYVPGGEYFHPASVFKAAAMARVRTKSRSSSGECLFM